jgi:hypothetical protein
LCLFAFWILCEVFLVEEGGKNDSEEGEFNSSNTLHCTYCI